MLVLSRKMNEKIIIQGATGDITLAVIAVKGNVVRLGFDAPADVGIYREEILGNTPAPHKIDNQE